MLRLFILSAVFLAACTDSTGSSDGGGDDGSVDGGEGIAGYDLLFSNGEDLCGMRIDGTREVVLKRGGEFDGYDHFAQMAISPDGSKIVYAAVCAGSRFLRVMDANLGDPVNLTEECGPDATWPAFSPDGSLIAFIGRYWTDEEKGAYLYVMNADGSEPRRVTALDGIYDPNDRGPAFSSDGTRIFFTSGRGGNTQLWSIGVNGAEPTVHVTNEGYVSDPVPLWVTVHPTTAAVYHVSAYVAVLDNTPNVYRLSDGARLTDEPQYAIERPTVSSDGQTLVFAREIDFFTKELQALDLGGGSAVTISSNDFHEFKTDPVFVPKP